MSNGHLCFYSPSGPTILQFCDSQLCAHRLVSTEEENHSRKQPGQEQAGYKRLDDPLLSVLLHSGHGNSLMAKLNAPVQRGPTQERSISLKGGFDQFDGPVCFGPDPDSKLVIVFRCYICHCLNIWSTVVGISFYCPFRAKWSLDLPSI